MAINPEKAFDPAPFRARLHGAPIDIETPEVGAEYPKFIEPHADHIEKGPDDLPRILGREYHLDRAGNLTVMVADAEDEAAMTSPKKTEENA